MIINISMYMKVLFYQIYVKTFPKTPSFPTLLIDQKLLQHKVESLVLG